MTTRSVEPEAHSAGKRPPPLPNHQLLAVAVEAKADPRTVRRFLLGRPVRPFVQERIERALRVLNLDAAGERER